MSELGPRARALLDAARDGHAPSVADKARVQAKLTQAVAAGAGPSAVVAAGAGAKVAGVLGVAALVAVTTVAIVDRDRRDPTTTETANTAAASAEAARSEADDPSAGDADAVAGDRAAPSREGLADRGAPRPERTAGGRAPPAGMTDRGARTDGPASGTDPRGEAPAPGSTDRGGPRGEGAWPGHADRGAAPAVRADSGGPRGEGPLAAPAADHAGGAANTRAAVDGSALAGVAPSDTTQARGSPVRTSTLGEELAILARAREALAAGDARAALALALEHEARFPAGALAEERVASIALAYCALGDRTAAAEARRRLPPRSSYLARIEAACGAGETDR